MTKFLKKLFFYEMVMNGKEKSPAGRLGVQSYRVDFIEHRST
ncbi:hypothetical protein HPS_0936 [Glaesserella parasuis 29755]|nr:hypothetical protein HPS_0936 [Glaesserella parasuis 29755]